MEILRMCPIARSLWIALALAGLVPVPLDAQQHNQSPADLENGARIYNANCFACHGQNGDLIAGVDLRRGLFRHVSTDRKSTRLNSSHLGISYAVFCLKKK